MSYRLAPLAPAAARYSGSRTTRAAGCAASSVWMAVSSLPALAAASRGTRKHSRSRSASWLGSTPLLVAMASMRRTVARSPPSPRKASTGPGVGQA
jgi:hypothetical protein